MFLKKAQVDVENLFHERIMAVISQELVLKTHKDSLVSETRQTPLQGCIRFLDSKVQCPRY